MRDKVLIASGPTLEAIDPVRFLSNRSSGKTGFFLAEEAKRRGRKNVVFVTGPTAFLPKGVKIVHVESARQMDAAIERHRAGSRVIIMAAAVTDFRPTKILGHKIKKSAHCRFFVLKLVPNPDILKNLGQSKPANQILIGFALETEQSLLHARRKLEEKNLDLVVLNEISPRNPAFGVDENRVTLITRNHTQRLAKTSKARIAAAIWDTIETLAGPRPATQ